MILLFVVNGRVSIALQIVFLGMAIVNEEKSIVVGIICLILRRIDNFVVIVSVEGLENVSFPVE